MKSFNKRAQSREQGKDPHRKERWRQFADYIESEIRRLNNLESWSHYRFTELEAEVELEGEYRFAGMHKKTEEGLLRVDSLSEALKISEERLILLQGDPGSGKSVAFRQIALDMAQNARQSQDCFATIPLYINLKNLTRIPSDSFTELNQLNYDPVKLREILITYFNQSELQDICFELAINYEYLAGSTLPDKSRELVLLCKRQGRINQLVELCVKKRSNIPEIKELTGNSALEDNLPAIDQNLIRSFVLKTLNRAKDRDVEVFLEEEFEPGMKNKSWIFLFDSFDEIPEILSSTEADEMIQAYGDAIRDFLLVMNQCRGIIASRIYRGPQRLGWKRFRILPLKPERQRELIQRTGLDSEKAEQLMIDLDGAEHSLKVMSSNPLFLGLISEFVKQTGSFPTNTHDVFEAYVNERLTRDRERLEHHFALTPKQLRYAAERLAFTMTADEKLGLNPERLELQNATIRQDMTLGEQFNIYLDALEFLKLAKAESGATLDASKTFSFAHRRFQEFFATSIVLNSPELMNPNRLLTDGRWRETAIVLCQTQSLDNLQGIIYEANRLVAHMVEQFPRKQVKINEGVENEIQSIENEPNVLGFFPWPPRSLHLFGILQEGFSTRKSWLPGELQENASLLMLSATTQGVRLDKKWALEVAGVLDEDELSTILVANFGQSQLLNDIIYRQVARLSYVTQEIHDAIIHTLCDMFKSGLLRRQKNTVRSHLTRLDKSERFITVLDRLLSIPKMGIGFAILLVTPLLFLASRIDFFLIGIPSVGAFLTEQIVWNTLLNNGQISVKEKNNGKSNIQGMNAVILLFLFLFLFIDDISNSPYFRVLAYLLIISVGHLFLSFTLEIFFENNFIKIAIRKDFWSLLKGSISINLTTPTKVQRKLVIIRAVIVAIDLLGFILVFIIPIGALFVFVALIISQGLSADIKLSWFSIYVIVSLMLLVSHSLIIDMDQGTDKSRLKRIKSDENFTINSVEFLQVMSFIRGTDLKSEFVQHVRKHFPATNYDNDFVELLKQFIRLVENEYLAYKKYEEAIQVRKDNYDETKNLFVNLLNKIVDNIENFYQNSKYPLYLATNERKAIHYVITKIRNLTFVESYAISDEFKVGDWVSESDEALRKWYQNYTLYAPLRLARWCENEFIDGLSLLLEDIEPTLN